MNIGLTVLAIAIWGWLTVIWVRRILQRRAFERISITPEALHALMETKHEVTVLDVRQPLDLLVDSDIIVGAIRISPEDAEKNPGIVPLDKELVVYCTCPSDKTSRSIAMRAKKVADISKVKFLKGGLAAWKAKGYPVVPYDKTFHLDTGT
jgi:rhodanese-related sulfurtransferase